MDLIHGNRSPMVGFGQVLSHFSGCSFCDKIQFWEAVLDMLQSLFGSVFNTKVVEKSFLFHLGFEPGHLEVY